MNDKQVQTKNNSIEAIKQEFEQYHMVQFLKPENPARRYIDHLPKQEQKKKMLQVLMGFYSLISRQDDEGKNYRNKVLRCDPNSIQNALFECIQFDMIPGKKEQCALIPYGSDLTFQPMYKGLTNKILKDDYVTKIDCECVRKGDKFEYQQGSNAYLNFTKNLFDERGDVIAFYCVFHLKNGSQFIEVMTNKEVLAIKARAKTQKLWNSDYEEMGRKTVLKRAYKRIIREDKAIDTIELDNALERPDIKKKDDLLVNNLNATLENLEHVENETDLLGIESENVDVSAEDPTSAE